MKECQTPLKRLHTSTSSKASICCWRTGRALRSCLKERKRIKRCTDGLLNQTRLHTCTWSSGCSKIHQTCINIAKINADLNFDESSGRIHNVTASVWILIIFWGFVFTWFCKFFFHLSCPTIRHIASSIQRFWECVWCCQFNIYTLNQWFH